MSCSVRSAVITHADPSSWPPLSIAALQIDAASAAASLMTEFGSIFQGKVLQGVGIANYMRSGRIKNRSFLLRLWNFQVILSQLLSMLTFPPLIKFSSRGDCFCTSDVEQTTTEMCWGSVMRPRRGRVRIKK